LRKPRFDPHVGEAERIEPASDDLAVRDRTLQVGVPVDVTVERLDDLTRRFDGTLCDQDAGEGVRTRGSRLCVRRLLPELGVTEEERGAVDRVDLEQERSFGVVDLLLLPRAGLDRRHTAVGAVRQREVVVLDGVAGGIVIVGRVLDS
jgi:hypothetical protein